MKRGVTGVLARLTSCARQGSAFAHPPPEFRLAGAPGGLELTACPGMAVPAHPASPELGPARRHQCTAYGAHVNGVQHRCYAFAPCGPRPVDEPSAAQPSELQLCCCGRPHPCLDRTKQLLLRFTRCSHVSCAAAQPAPTWQTAVKKQRPHACRIADTASHRGLGIRLCKPHAGELQLLQLTQVCYGVQAVVRKVPAGSRVESGIGDCGYSR